MAGVAGKLERQVVPLVNARITRMEQEAVWQAATIATAASLVAAEWKLLNERRAANGKPKLDMALKNRTSAIPIEVLGMIARTAAEMGDAICEALGERDGD
jgi:hypothetical protein